jgi:hypothetical protein
METKQGLRTVCGIGEKWYSKMFWKKNKEESDGQCQSMG